MFMKIDMYIAKDRSQKQYAQQSLPRSNSNQLSRAVPVTDRTEASLGAGSFTFLGLP